MDPEISSLNAIDNLQAWIVALLLYFCPILRFLQILDKVIVTPCLCPYSSAFQGWVYKSVLQCHCRAGPCNCVFSVFSASSTGRAAMLTGECPVSRSLYPHSAGLSLLSSVHPTLTLPRNPPTHTSAQGRALVGIMGPVQSVFWSHLDRWIIWLLSSFRPFCHIAEVSRLQRDCSKCECWIWTCSMRHAGAEGPGYTNSNYGPGTGHRGWEEDTGAGQGGVKWRYCRGGGASHLPSLSSQVRFHFGCGLWLVK